MSPNGIVSPSSTPTNWMDPGKEGEGLFHAWMISHGLTRSYGGRGGRPHTWMVPCAPSSEICPPVLLTI